MELETSVTEVIARLTYIVENKKVKEESSSSLVWCVETLQDLRANLGKMAAFSSYMKIQQKLKLSEELKNFAAGGANKPGKLASSDMVSYLTSEFIPEQISMDMSVLYKKHRTKAVYEITNEWMTKYSLEIMHTKDVAAILSSLSWDTDVFRLNGMSYGRPLTCASFAIFRKRSLFKSTHLDIDVFARFILTLEEGHNAIPYHNSIHATDVLISADYVLSLPPLQNVLSDFEVMVILIACASHDLDHTGFTNRYLVNTKHKLSDLYIDSINERGQYHAFCQILKFESCNITQDMTSRTRRHFFHMVEQIILATDNAKHNMLLEKMALLKLGMAGHDLNLSKDTDQRLIFLQSLVHVCDIGYPTKIYSLYQVWMGRVASEYFRQGDSEAEKGLAISPMCDSQRNNVLECQIGFIDFIVSPAWTIFGEIMGPTFISEMMNNLKLNRTNLENRQSIPDLLGIPSVPGAASEEDLSFNTCSMDQ